MTWTLGWLAVAWAADVDGDGVDAALDCDDADAAVYPGAPEGAAADGVDQDCSGTADDVVACGGAGNWLQTAIDAAPDGFVVRVCAGNHAVTARVVGRALTLRGDAGAAGTSLNASGLSPVIAVRGGADVVVEGLTLRNGASTTHGGGVACTDSAVAVIDSTIVGGRAKDGGGVGARNCALTVEGTVIRGGVATGNGGGLWASGSEGSVAASLLVDGAALEGGGLWADGGVAVRSTTFKGNTATSTANDYVGGGGAWIGGDSSVETSTFVENHASMCGGALYSKYGSGDVWGNVFQANSADDDGGAVYFDWAYAEFRNNYVLYNTADDDAGGLRVYRGAMVIEDNLVQGNTANDDGGGVKMSHATHTYRRNVHRDNTTGDAGGGLEMDNDSSTIEDCTFERNEAGRGGGLHSWRNEAPNAIVRSSFRRNVATSCGGAMAFDNDPHPLELRWLDLRDNRSDDDGGALCIEYREQDGGFADMSDIRLRQSSVRDSVAADEGGVAKVEYGDLSIDQALLDDSEAAVGSVLLVQDDGAAWLRNTAVDGASGGSALDVQGNGVIQSSYSLWWDISGGYGAVGDPVGVSGNIGADPLLDRDGRPLAGSPCVDAGDPARVDDDGSRSDIGRYGGLDAE